MLPPLLLRTLISPARSEQTYNHTRSLGSTTWRERATNRLGACHRQAQLPTSRCDRAVSLVLWVEWNRLPRQAPLSPSSTCKETKKKRGVNQTQSSAQGGATKTAISSPTRSGVMFVHVNESSSWLRVRSATLRPLAPHRPTAVPTLPSTRPEDERRNNERASARTIFMPAAIIISVIINPPPPPPPSSSSTPSSSSSSSSKQTATPTANHPTSEPSPGHHAAHRGQQPSKLQNTVK